jgi:FkbM family methyltransferase
MATLNIHTDGTSILSLAVPEDKQTDFLVREIFTEYCYLPVPPVHDARVIEDVGANVGLAAAYLRLSWPDAEIHCFEPAPAPLSYLQINARRIGNCMVHPFGLYSCDKTATMFLGREGMATTSLFHHNYSSDERISIPLRDAFSAFQEILQGRDIDILKLDTEGCELPILNRARTFLQTARLIYIEFHSEADRRNIDDLLFGSHILWRAEISSPHRGLLTYVLRSVLPERLPADAL